VKYQSQIHSLFVKVSIIPQSITTPLSHQHSKHCLKKFLERKFRFLHKPAFSTDNQLTPEKTQKISEYTYHKYQQILLFITRTL
jgi:hypothetical protein